MKLGIFDSGLGGLMIARAVRRKIPDLDILYYGDTLHLPYGNRSEEAILMYTRRAMDYLFALDCKLIVIACNTASGAALRRLQQSYLPQKYPDRNILGVIVPTLETALQRGYKNLGLIGTSYIIRSQIYREELLKLDPGIKISQVATPLLVPLIENDGKAWIEDVLRQYLDPLLRKNIECLLLGCTHYASLKEEIRNVAGRPINLIAQDEIIPEKLEDYLRRHPEYGDEITRTAHIEFQVSDLTENYIKAAHAIYGEEINILKTQGNP